MKVYIAKEHDTLIKIAEIHHLQTDQIISLNPHIANIDQNIAGMKVKIPSRHFPLRSQKLIAPCPPEEPSDFLDHWIPLASLDNLQQTEYDVLIVGSGAGGAAVLWRLCQQFKGTGKRVAIVEAGDLLLPTHIAAALGLELIPANGHPAVCRMPAVLPFHDMGTCRMGVDPSASATDEYGQIHGISGLFVADNSILVTVGAANPTLTTVAMALRTADHIIRQLK